MQETKATDRDSRDRHPDVGTASATDVEKEPDTSTTTVRRESQGAAEPKKYGAEKPTRTIIRARIATDD
jgi:hypothetical protein